MDIPKSTSEETWRTWPKNDKILVSNLGRIFSLRKKRYLKGSDFKGYKVCRPDNIKSFIHRMVMESFVGISDLVVDHIDHNKSNNRLTNLRYVTNQQNMTRNSNKVRSDSKTGIRGVWKKGNRWSSELNIRGKKIRKLFKNIEDAISHSIEIRKGWMP